MTKKVKDGDLENVAGGFGVLTQLGDDGKSNSTGSFRGREPVETIPGGGVDLETEEQPEGDKNTDLG